jgi:very-short-patch-repair endonuclease
VANKVEKNVFSFINKCSEEIGIFHNNKASQLLYCSCLDLELSSPIEQILYCALETLRILNFIERAETIKTKNGDSISGLYIYPQYKIDIYRVDFLVIYGSPLDQNKEQPYYKQVIVECDSQQFHERTEEERRYEKGRDRYLIKKGHKIFHFTGKEIITKSFDVAAEIIAYLKNEDIENIQTNANC